MILLIVYFAGFIPAALIFKRLLLIDTSSNIDDAFWGFRILVWPVELVGAIAVILMLAISWVIGKINPKIYG